MMTVREEQVLCKLHEFIDAKICLIVPFRDKDMVESLGFRWDRPSAAGISLPTAKPL